MVVLCSAQVHVSNTRMVKPHFIDHVSLALAPHLYSQDICATDRTWHLRLSIRVRASRGAESIARGPFPWEVASDIGMSVHSLRASLTFLSYPRQFIVRVGGGICAEAYTNCDMRPFACAAAGKRDTTSDNNKQMDVNHFQPYSSLCLTRAGPRCP